MPFAHFIPAWHKGGMAARSEEGPPRRQGGRLSSGENQKEIPVSGLYYGLKIKLGDSGNSFPALLSFLPMLTEDRLANSGWGFSLPELFFSFIFIN